MNTFILKWILNFVFENHVVVSSIVLEAMLEILNACCLSDPEVGPCRNYNFDACTIFKYTVIFVIIILTHTPRLYLNGMCL